MSDPIKQTLFRFASLRSPELITEENKQNYFVYHPDSSSGPFFALLPFDPSDDKREMLLETALGSGFTGKYESVDEIKTEDEELFAFSQWLVKNRESLTVASANAEITALSAAALDSAMRLKLWDNLFYQVLTVESSYIADAIIEMLIADSFITKKAGVDQENEVFRKLAKAKVALPKELFSFVAAQQSESEVGITENALINKTLLSGRMSSAISAVKAQLTDAAKREVETYQQQYNASYTSGYATARASFESDLQTWFSTAPTATATDQITGYTYEYYTTNDRPTIDFTPDEQVSGTALATELSPESYYVLTNNNLLEETTLSGLTNRLINIGATETQRAFDATTFSNKMIEVGGTVITGSENLNLGPAYSFYLHTVKRADTKYSLVMVMVAPGYDTKVNDATISLGAPASQTSSTFTCGVDGRILTIDLTPSGGFTIPSNPAELSVTGTINLLGGISLAINVVLNMLNGSYSIATATTPTGQTANIYTAKNYGIKRLGVTDYKKVEQSLCGYKPGEVSHIENILAHEYKERSTRRLRRSEDTTTTTTESERESLTDTTSTSRYELQSEISEMLRKDTSWGVNANVSANYGSTTGAGINVSVGANYAQNTSKEMSKNQSSTFAQDVVEKASEKVVAKVKEERIYKIIEEFEEQNKHGFDNRLGENHISGVYRWVDKEYKNDLINYGKRLLYEFMVPEPARLHYETRASIGGQKIIEEPIDPRAKSVAGLGKLENSSKLNETNYQSWAAQYNAEVQPPPAIKQLVGKSYSKSQQQGDGNQWQNKAMTDNIVIPEGYGLDKAFLSLTFYGHDSGSNVAIGIADTHKMYFQNETRSLFLTDSNILELDKYTDSVPVSMFFNMCWGGQVNISLELVRKKEIYEAWQLETFNAIITAYEDKLQQFKDELAQAEVKRGNMLATNPAYHREIEQTLIKKNCIEFMLGHTNIGQKHINGSTFTGTHVNNTLEMDKYAATVKFFEQAFEWEIMSYKFYPFYWADKNNWVEMYSFENDDPIFRDFMRAGMARVNVSVKPGFELAVMFYLETGQIWNGGHEPVINDPMYLSIADEIKEIDGDIESTWITRLPSTLTLVQNGTAALNASGLPNWCTTGTIGTETIDAADPGTALGVYIEGYTPPPTV